MRHGWLVGGFLALALSCVVPAAAEPVWQRVGVFKRIEADPTQSYRITDQSGPWMIMAVTFLGETAEDQARELVYELRSRFKLHAYTHTMEFDYSGTVTGRTLDRRGAPAKMKYRRDDKYQEIAVLVGDYPSVDDPQAQKTLEKLKYAKPNCLLPKEGRSTSRPLAQLRMMQQEAQRLLGDEQKDYGPMGHAFVTTNPLLPREYFAPKGLDPLVIKMNKEVEHSLLACPGKYSVRVATFTGEVKTLDPNKVAAMPADVDPDESKLAQAAVNAHKMTMALRAQGVEAYEFHDRYMSIVTVGSFETVGTPRADGKIEINPQIHKIMETYGAPQQAGGGQQVSVKAIKKIPFDVQPLPVEVPRAQLSGAYTKRSLFD